MWFQRHLCHDRGAGISIPFGNNTPNWILWIARIFPVKHFADRMQAGFLGTAFHWTDVLVVAAWGPGRAGAGHALLQLGAPPGLTAARQRAPAGPFAESVLVAAPARALQD